MSRKKIQRVIYSTSFGYVNGDGMKTFICWLIARAPETIIVLEILVMAIVKEKHIIISDKLSIQESALDYLLVAVIGCVLFPLMIMIYTYRNIDEVISKQFKWRNSKVDSFHYRLSYSWNRCQMSFVVCLLFFYILSLLFKFQL